MSSEKYIGAHVSASGGVFHAPKNAHELGATAFALFVKNQRRWTSPALTPVDIQKFKDACDEYGYAPEQILPHDGYLINLGNPDEEKRKKSLDAFIDEVRRCEALGLKYLNFHPGSHLKQVDEEQCLSLIAQSLSEALAQTESLTFVIENTAGQGTNLGYRLEHLASIIQQSDNPQRMGVCLDTCHTYASGYDIKNDWKGFAEQFEKLIGFDNLKGMHINDSKKELGSRVDRHHSLGEGTLGLDFFKEIMKDSRLNGIPLILETPDTERWAEEIKQLKNNSG